MLTLIRYPFHPVLPQWHVKAPGHSTKSAGDKLHLITHTLLTQRSRIGLIMLSGHSMGTYQGKRAHTQLVRKHSATVFSSLNLKKKEEKKKRRRGMNCKNLPPKSSQESREPPPPPPPPPPFNPNLQLLLIITPHFSFKQFC